MKKFSLFMMSLVFCLMMVFASCERNKTQNQTVEAPAIEQVAELNVEHLIAMDKQDMYLNYGTDYRYYETCILLNDYLDEDNDGSIAGVSNIFQSVIRYDSLSFDTFVVMFAHTPDTSSVEVVHSFWIEDFPMENDAIELTFCDAYNRVMEANYPKPHSKHVVLRKEIGPKACNPQYIFGNLTYQLYVDAITGDVTDKSPAFNDSLNFGTPLGEWP